MKEDRRRWEEHTSGMQDSRLRKQVRGYKRSGNRDAGRKLE